MRLPEAQTIAQRIANQSGKTVSIMKPMFSVLGSEFSVFYSESTFHMKEYIQVGEDIRPEIH